MASKTTLNKKNLEQLGASRLADLVLEISQGDAAAKRRLRLELAGTAGAADVAREVRKRLASLERTRSQIFDADKRKALVKDLETQRKAIVDQVGLSDPHEAMELMWRFVALAGPTLERCEDRSGTVFDVFRQGCNALPTLAEAAAVDPDQLAERTFMALTANDYGQLNALIPALAPLLGDHGLVRLKTMMTEFGEQVPERPPQAERRVVGGTSGGPIYADDLERRRHARIVRWALQQIAEARGDVDEFIANIPEDAHRTPHVATEIGRRLLDAGRAEEALAALDAAEGGPFGWFSEDWAEARADALEALGRTAEAQEFRWACFERSLSEALLRAYLKRLPEFDDVEAEEKALERVTAHPDVHGALAFLVRWSALHRAARMVLDRTDEIDGDHYEALTPAADALQERHPLAATVLRRAMIEFALDQARAKRYRHAARHFQQCASAATMIEDCGQFETHEAFKRRLKSQHARKRGFWNLLA